MKNRTIPGKPIRPRVDRPTSSHIHRGLTPFFNQRDLQRDSRLKELFRLNLIEHRLQRRPDLLYGMFAGGSSGNPAPIDRNDIRVRHGRKLSRALDVFTVLGILLLFGMFGEAFAGAGMENEAGSWQYAAMGSENAVGSSQYAAMGRENAVGSWQHAAMVGENAVGCWKYQESDVAVGEDGTCSNNSGRHATSANDGMSLGDHLIMNVGDPVRTEPKSAAFSPIILSGTVWSAPTNTFPVTDVTVYDNDGMVFLGSTTTRPEPGSIS